MDIKFIAAIDNEEEMATPLINQAFLESPWYADIIYVLLNLQAPLELCRTKEGFEDEILKILHIRQCFVSERS